MSVDCQFMGHLGACLRLCGRAGCGFRRRRGRPSGSAYDPGAVPDWAHETIAHIAREHPEHLAYHRERVAEIEVAKRRTAGQPPEPPAEPRDLLHLAAIQA